MSGADRLTYVGHATVLLELGGVRLLTDPVLRSRFAHLRRHGRRPDPAIGERIDAVLISHLHYDHLDLPSLRRIDDTARVLAPKGAGEFLRKAGVEHVTELESGEATEVNGVEVEAVPAAHPSSRRPRGPSAQPVGFRIHGDRRRIYFPGDTDLFPEMSELAGGLDLALLPVWGWGTSAGAGHLDPERAAQAAALLQPSLAIPIHWGTFFPFGLHRVRGHLLRDPPHEFARQVAERAPGVGVRVLDPGDALALDSSPGESA
jgi:L-ascorbate metabolism protein UlaG (beta-lactamase superfamily)